MKFYFSFFLVLVFTASFSQPILLSKPPIDTSILNKWPTVTSGAVSNNGEYVTYVINEFMPKVKSTTVVQAPNANWKMELEGATITKFTNDSRNLLYMKNDTLFILKLGKSRVDAIPQVQFFNLVQSKTGELLVYQLKSNERPLVIKETKTGKEKRFGFIDRYLFSPDGKTVILQTTLNSKNERQLKWVSLIDGKQISIWSGDAQPKQIIFNDGGAKLAFITEENGNSILWHYIKGSPVATQLTKDGDVSLKGLFVGQLKRFSKDGKLLFFNLESRKIVAKRLPESANVNIWSTNDLILQSELQQNLKNRNELINKYLSVIDVSTGRIIQLQKGAEQVASMSDEYCIIRQFKTNQEIVGNGIYFTNAVQNSVYYLVSLRDGSRFQMPWKKPLSISFSPNGKYIVFTERGALNYYIYELVKGVVHNITSEINENLAIDNYYFNLPKENQALIPIGGWLKDDAGILLFDRNDIWLVDPLGRQKPQNLTNGYGRKLGIIFRPVINSNTKRRFVQGQKLILAAFNKRTKENGYYFIVLGQKADPVLINMESSVYAFHPIEGDNIGDMTPSFLIKARDKDAYLLTKETTTNFPNYYYTKDLKTFYRLTNLHPEKQYNWMTSELHTWVASDGDTLQGVLYKPENFDSLKKYPMLFTYYRQYSDEVNMYWIPEWISGRINIPWFVSHGYLVFTPDIHYNDTRLRKSILNCVLSATKHVAKLPYVDTMHMGIQGHSFGGFETGHIVTGTNIFAAACAASGYYDLISDVGTIMPAGFWRGTSEVHMRGPIWEKQSEFIENSPIFYLDRIRTPLLVVTGNQDDQVPHNQSIELFLGLRRLEKTAWMLTYPDESHAIEIEKDTKDCTIRITQFFDHYLKGTPAPFWMTGGIIGKLDGIQAQYGLDLSGHCRSDCNVCKKWNAQRN
jgi:dipeptidyl aminopeptidase/acylaminoacyl peptidase